MKLFILVLLLIAIVVFPIRSTEGFQANSCGMHQSCKMCASAEGCSWCPKTKECKRSSFLTLEDKDCNQNNSISSIEHCGKNNTPEIDLKDDLLYRDRIADRVRPPNVYSNPEMEYSNETVMGNLSDIRREVKRVDHQLLTQANWYSN